jgi:hypothetical protein
MIANTGRVIAMLAIDERSAPGGPHLQDAYFDGSLELLRELAVTSDLDTALPRLSAIVSKMLPHDALRMACFDQRGQLMMNASTADVPDMTASEREEVIIDDLRTGTLGAPSGPQATKRLVGAGYRSALGVSTRAPEPLVRVAFGRSGRSHSIAPMCRSRAGSRTTSASEHLGARTATSLTRSTTSAPSGSTRTCSHASTG